MQRTKSVAASAHESSRHTLCRCRHQCGSAAGYDNEYQRLCITAPIRAHPTLTISTAGTIQRHTTHMALLECVEQALRRHHSVLIRYGMAGLTHCNAGTQSVISGVLVFGDDVTARDA
jgi:hypothetical protein